MRTLYFYIYSHPRFVLLTLIVMVAVMGILEWMADSVYVDNKKLKAVFKTAVWAELLASGIMFLYVSLFNRSSAEERRYELQLFWSYKMALYTKNSFWYRQILYNILAFVPIGNALDYLLHKKHSLIYILGSFLMISVSVELMQLIFRLGLFELDDIFNNLFGGMTGMLLAESIRRIFQCNKKGK